MKCRFLYNIRPDTMGRAPYDPWGDCIYIQSKCCEMQSFAMSGASEKWNSQKAGQYRDAWWEALT